MKHCKQLHLFKKMSNCIQKLRKVVSLSAGAGAVSSEWLRLCHTELHVYELLENLMVEPLWIHLWWSGDSVAGGSEAGAAGHLWEVRHCGRGLHSTGRPCQYCIYHSFLFLSFCFQQAKTMNTPSIGIFFNFNWYSLF